jgi:molybdate transport system substrate-binding protein
MPKPLCLSLIFLFGLMPVGARAEQALIAVAANFKSTALLLNQQFANRHPQHQLQFSSASTGILFNQIRHGAPFHALLAADAKSPQQLENLGSGIKNTRFTYALGQLVLASKTQIISNTKPHTSDIKNLLQQHKNHIAIANPKLAPYGLAAQQTLTTLSLWDDLKPILIQGNNISQTQQFVMTANASLGFISQSPLLDQHNIHFLQIPSDWHKPIRQQAILLQSGQNNQAAKDFLAFIKTSAAVNIIKQQGYRISDASRN